MENQDKKAAIEALKLESKKPNPSNNTSDKMINYIYQQLGEIYTLQGVCLEILKGLEQKKELNSEESYWYNELVTVLFEQDAI